MTAQPGRPPCRFYVRSATGDAIIGVDAREAAVALALDFGAGAHLVDTHAQAYHPIIEEVAEGALSFLAIGGWNTRRHDPDIDLIEAIKKGHVALVHAFLAKGADSCARDDRGGTALHWAVAGGRAEIVRLLLDHGADRAATDGSGLSALALAKSRGNAVLADLLAG
jgi:Ankyrin repeats (3 copies)